MDELAKETLERFRHQGFTVQVLAGKLIISPRDHITPEMRVEILRTREELLRILTMSCEHCRSWNRSFPGAPHGICHNTDARQARFQDATSSCPAFMMERKDS